MRESEVSTTPALVTAEWVAQRTGLHAHTIYKWVREERIPYVRLGRSVRFDRERLEAWFQAGGTASERREG
jgi:excisionase family DNA binding protein